MLKISRMLGFVEIVKFDIHLLICRPSINPSPPFFPPLNQKIIIRNLACLEHEH